MKKRIAVVRGAFLNAYEMQMFSPLEERFSLTAFSSLRPIHEKFDFPVRKLPCPMDIPNIPYKMQILNRVFIDAHYLFGLEAQITGFDLVHTAETYYHYTQQAIHARQQGRVKKVIATVLETIPYNNEGIWGRKKFKLNARRELDHIIALTSKAKESLLVEGADEKKISILGFHIDTNRFSRPDSWTKKLADPGKRKFTILYVGRLEEEKGIFDILQAAKRLVGDSRLTEYTLNFSFVGNGSQKERLEQAVRMEGLEARVSFSNSSYEQMPEVYSKGDILIAPSKPIKTWEEQYCMVLLEAQAMGLPIVTTRSGGIPENVGDSALLVEHGDIDGLTESVCQYILSPKLRLTYANRARNRALSVHDITIGARKLGNIYDAVLNG